MEKARATLVKSLGEKAADDFIENMFTLENVDEIKKRVCALLDTRKFENQQVYKILMQESQRRKSFNTQGYRKGDTNPNALCVTVQEEKKPEVKKTGSVSDDKSIKGKQKTKFFPLFGEGAHSDQLVVQLPGRHPCQCLATKHQLVNNCLNCGRIVCAQEGSGSCFFCGTLVFTHDDHLVLAKGGKVAEKLIQRVRMAKWAPGVQPLAKKESKNKAKGNKSTTPVVSGQPKTNRVSNGESTTITKSMDAMEIQQEYLEVENQCVSDEEDFRVDTMALASDAQARLEQGIVAALEHRDRLLEFDATSAQRSRVLDDELDYFASEGGGGAAAWLSPEVRERVRRRVEELRAQRHSSRLQSVRLCLDFAGRQVIEEDTREDASRQLYAPTQEEIIDLERPQETTDQTLSSDRILDPTIGIPPPQFLAPDLDIWSSHKISPLSQVLQQQSLSANPPRLQDDICSHLPDEGHCLSMHQPWASLLVRGIKRAEGRTWYSAHRGRLWIAATAKIADPTEISTVEQMYLSRGFPKSSFPTSYPNGCLLGCVNVVEVLAQEEYREKCPDGESESPFVFLCDEPRELLLKLPIRGKHKIYKLESHIHKAAKKNLA